MGKTYRTTKQGEHIQDKDRKNMKASRGCLNHGGCPYCESNREHSTQKRKPLVTKEERDDYRSFSM